MATSDSDNFESADEDTEFRDASMKKSSPQWTYSSPIDSDSDDNICDKTKRNFSQVKANSSQEITTSMKKTSEVTRKTEKEEVKVISNEGNTELKNSGDGDNSVIEKGHTSNATRSVSRSAEKKKTKIQKSKESTKPKGLGAKRISETVTSLSLDNVKISNEEVKEKNEQIKNSNKVLDDWNLDDHKATEILRDSFDQSYEKSWIEIGNKSLDEFDKNVPEELKSNKKFKEIFRPDGWQDLENEKIITPTVENKHKTSLFLDEVAKVNEEKDDSGSGWGSWGNWGVTSLLSTASAGVSTLTSHVTQGLTILEESIISPTAANPVQNEEAENTESVDTSPTIEIQDSFGFSNLISGVSSITKLVEDTGTRVITGGLNTLETIGKKTMEVLQEGDPGLKKKRAFFTNELSKPILSQVLREAKDKAETEARTIEEKKLARRIHFESIFDDFQGLVHLEALEMLSKQSEMKIQQRIVSLNVEEGISLQETLDEVKELCDISDEDEGVDDDDKLEEQLKFYYSESGINASFDKINQIWTETKEYINNVSSPQSTVGDQEVFEKAILTIAQFTACSVEQFHKVGELLLIKGNRSTVNEADSLVHITKILSRRVETIANLFSKSFNQRSQSEKSVQFPGITTIFLEANNASSYIQEAFRLLIPILQIGVI
ncbi:protein FAM114A2 isoform X2 [Chelonus insularis]|uniref:protein FAM114A2 isoform X2 n=1 Tax=Chelonus insularis TaxID=460826 RepID=UPI00158AF055|nr:protein FAM114A2 isoform X2 [Chelonus insularis]